MSDLRELMTQDQRLCILRTLQGQADYRLNESVLQTVLETYGHTVSRDTVRTELSWLAEQGLLELETVAGRTMVARLTERGGDVATGRARAPGVKRPSPGAK